MRVNPITPAYRSADKPKQRAFMIIHHDKHEVVDTLTGERFHLPAKAAWEKHKELNR